MNCPNCGAEISKHAKFCSNCGQKLSDVADAANVEDAAGVADAANVEKTDALAESTEPAPETAPDNSTTATEVIAPAEAAEPVDTATDQDATVLAEYPADDEDATAAETSLLEVSADDSYITPDEAPTAVTDSDAIADADADADADPTVIANSNAADEEPTTFINDPDRIDVFTSDDVDSTAISHFDPSQFTVVSSGPSSVERKQTEDGSDSLRKVAFGLLAAVLVVGVLAIAWVIQSHQDDAAKRSAVQQRIATYQEQIESVGVDPRSDSSRVELLNQYEKLNEIEEQIQADQKNGQFRMPNGSDDTGINVLNSSISDRQKSIRDWFEADYKRRLTANSFNDTDTANTMDQKSVANKLVELQALLGDIEHEKVIWGDDTGNNSAYDSYHSRVSDQIKKGETLKSGVAEKTKKEQEQKDKTRSPRKTARKLKSGLALTAVPAPTASQWRLSSRRTARSSGASAVNQRFVAPGPVTSQSLSLTSTVRSVAEASLSPSLPPTVEEP